MKFIGSLTSVIAGFNCLYIFDSEKGRTSVNTNALSHILASLSISLPFDNQYRRTSNPPKRPQGDYCVGGAGGGCERGRAGRIVGAARDAHNEGETRGGGKEAKLERGERMRMGSP